MTGSAVFAALELYEARGLHVRTGLSPWHFGSRAYRNLPLSSLFSAKGKHGLGGGIAFGEMFFLEALCAAWRPQRILVIGNSFGLSSVLLALAAPQAKVVAIDAGVEGEDNARGTALTREIAAAQKLDLEVVEGFSPQAVPQVVRERLGGRLDLALIDGLHTVQQQELDFEACWREGGDDAVYCLHDVLNYDLLEGFQQLAARHGAMRSSIQWRCASGLGVIFPRAAQEPVQRVIGHFSEPQEILEKTRREVALEFLTGLPGREQLQRIAPKWVVRAARSLLYRS